jgi:hypothetical protein
MDDWKKKLGNVKRMLEARKETRRALEKERQNRGGVPTGRQRPLPAPNAPTARPGTAKASSGMTISTPTGRRGAYEYPAARDPLPNEPLQGPQGFNIGIDFGTSMTKVCVRQALGEGEDIPIIPLILGRSPLCPSLAAISRDQLFFGQEAERHQNSSATLLPYLKACLACEVERETPPLAACRLMGGRWGALPR